MIKVKRIVALTPGVYEAVLKTINERQVKKYESDEMEDVITFTYEIETDGEPVTLLRDCRPLLGSKARLTKDLKAMAPDTATDDALASDESLDLLLKTLVRKRYLLQTDVTENGNTKIVAIMAKPRGKAAVKPAVHVEPIDDDQPPFLDDSDIPF